VNYQDKDKSKDGKMKPTGGDKTQPVKQSAPMLNKRRVRKMGVMKGY
jgi:hypothetical protein